MTETDIANIALGKIGGAGDQISGNAFLSSIDDTDKVSLWVNTQFPYVRQLVITDLAIAKCPFREATKFADLGAALVAASAPEMGQWQYAFNLPGDYLSMVRQFNENYMQDRHLPEHERKFEVVPNKNTDGLVLLTNDLTNVVDAGSSDSAYIEYSFDLTNTGIWSTALVDCVATRLAAEAAPIISKPDLRTPMLAEYDNFIVPQAQAFNRSQSNNNARKIHNYLGGRNTLLRQI